MRHSKASQQGSVLLVSLVLLLIVTLLGTAAMQGSTLESKMTINSQERQQAFNNAEAALRQAERMIDEGHFGNSDLRDGCSGSYCFNNTCANGFCFEGEFGAGASQDDCRTVATGDEPPTVGVWERLNVWSSSGTHEEVTFADGSEGKYIVEFRCFTDQIDDGSGAVGTVATNSGDVVYRVTARGTSKSGQVEAMVQSTYRATAP